jgi:hypothetical protein
VAKDKAPLRVERVEGKAGLEAFIRVPWRIQADDPNWVPPTVPEMRTVLNRSKGPFFEVGEAEYFLALRGDTPVGRVSAHVNRLHDELYQDATGFFGFFECDDDPEAAHALLDAAAHWCRGRGRTRIVGPRGFEIYDEVGVLIEGFDSMPALLQTHNPAYYPALMESWGLGKWTDWHALWMPNKGPEHMPENIDQRIDKILARNDFTLRRPTAREVIHRKYEVLELFNEAWKNNPGHVPFTRKQFDKVFSQLRFVLRSDLMRIILDPDDRLAAFIITVPDLNPTLQRLNGRLTVLDQLRLLVQARFMPLHKIRTLLLGVRREYQGKRLHHALIFSTFAGLSHNRSIVGCDCSLIPETLGFYIETLKGFGAEHYKTWRIYERGI